MREEEGEVKVDEDEEGRGAARAGGDEVEMGGGSERREGREGEMEMKGVRELWNGRHRWAAEDDVDAA